MAAGITPIFLKAPRVSFASTGVNANTAFDGTGTVATVFTAGADGSKVEDLIFQHLGSNSVTVVRVFVNNGSTNATATNNSLVYELSMAGNTASQTVPGTYAQTYRANLVLPAGYKINVTIGTAIASGIQVTAVGGDY